MQEGHGRRRAWAERSAAGRSAVTRPPQPGQQTVVVVGGDERPNLRQLPFELDLGKIGVLLALGDPGLAARTLRWEVVTDDSMWSGSGVGRSWRGCLFCPPACLPRGTRGGRGGAMGGSDDGGFEEFSECCWRRASTSATRCWSVAI